MFPRIDVGEYVAEIIFFLFKIGEAMLDPSVRLYIYQCTCLEIYPENNTCMELDLFPVIEREIQMRAATYIMTYKILLNMPAMLLGLFCGAWSDKIGRKLPVMLPCVGTILAVLCFMASMLPSVYFLPCILIGGAIRGAFGKSAIITMGLHSYITDISTKEDRTRRIGGLLAMNFFGFFAGSLIAGGLLDVSGFNVVFCTVVFISAACAFIAVSFMKDTLPPKPIEDEDQKVSKNPFKISNVRDSLDFILRPRKNNTRFHLLVLFATIFLNQGFKSGEVDVLLLFVERRPLHWRRSMYGYLLATDYACLGVGVLVFLPLLSNYLGFGDIILIIIGLSSRIVRLLMLTFSSVSWMVFLSVITGFPGGYIVSASKSAISKTVSEDEIGKAFSLLSCGETVSNMVGSIILTSVYQWTMDIHPGLVFGLDSIMFALWLLLILYLARDIHNQNVYRILDEETDTTTKTYGTSEGSKEFYAMTAKDAESMNGDAGKRTEILDFRKDSKSDMGTLDPISEKTRIDPVESDRTES